MSDFVFEDRTRDDDDGDSDIIRAVDDGNAALARTFASLAEKLEIAVDMDDFDKANDLITTIDRLSQLATVGR